MIVSVTATPAPATRPTVPTLGFSTLDREVTVDELELSGELPSWLNGSLLRTGPAKFEVGGQQMRHWFDGLAMLHRFTIEQGRVAYGNRFLESRSYRAARERGLPDNANVNVARLGERFVAMTETPLPVQFDPHTLKAAGVPPFQAPGQ